MKLFCFYLVVFPALLMLSVVTGGALFERLLLLCVFSSLFLLSYASCLRFFFVLMPSIYYFSQMGWPGNPITYFLVLVFLKYLLTSKGQRFDVLNIILAVLVVCIELFNLAMNGGSYIGEFLRWSTLFLFAVLLMSERTPSVSFSSLVNCFIYGFFVSSFAGVIFFYYGDSTEGTLNPVRRFSGLSGDPNSYGMYALLVLSFLLTKLRSVNGLHKPVFIWGGVVLVGFLSILTVSRTLLVCYAIIMAGYVLLNARSKRGIATISVLAACSIASAVVANYYGLFDDYAVRFSHSDLTGLTGSRSLIFVEYISGFFTVDLLRLLFGAGVMGYMYHYFSEVDGFNASGYFYEPIGPHNTFIELLISFGFVGAVLFLVLLYRCMKIDGRVGYGNIKYHNVLPLAVVVVYCFALQNLGQYVFYFILMLVAMSLAERQYGTK